MEAGEAKRVADELGIRPRFVVAVWRDKPIIHAVYVQPRTVEMVIIRDTENDEDTCAALVVLAAEAQDLLLDLHRAEEGTKGGSRWNVRKLIYQDIGCWRADRATRMRNTPGKRCAGGWSEAKS